MKPISDFRKVQAQLVIVTGLLVFFLIFDSRFLLYAATIVGLVSLFVKPLGNLLVWAWFKLAEGLGWLNSRILLSLVFYIFLFPLALAARLLGAHNGLRLKRPEDSVYVERNKTYTKADLENVW